MIVYRVINEVCESAQHFKILILGGRLVMLVFFLAGAIKTDVSRLFIEPVLSVR